jgi:hypothetical protein
VLDLVREGEFAIDMLSADWALIGQVGEVTGVTAHHVRTARKRVGGGDLKEVLTP